MASAPGTQLGSTCCDTQIVVIRPPDPEVALTCGGHPMVPLSQAPSERDAVMSGHDEGTLLGKRYVHEGSGLEVLCTRAGEGSLRADGEPLHLKEARAIPSSD